MIVLFLTTNPCLRAYSSLCMKDIFKQLFVLCFLEVIFLFLIKVSTLRTIEIETVFFRSLGNDKGCMRDYFFVLKLSVITK